MCNIRGVNVKRWMWFSSQSLWFPMSPYEVPTALFLAFVTCHPCVLWLNAGVLSSLSNVSQLRPVRLSGYFQRVICMVSVWATIDKSMYILCLKVKRHILCPDDRSAAHGIYNWLLYIYILWVKFGCKGNFYVEGHVRLEINLIG